MIRILLLLCAVAGLANFSSQAESLDALRGDIKSSIVNGEWDAAKAKIKQFQKLGKSAVAKEAKRFKKWRAGRKRFVKVSALYEKKKLAPRDLQQRLDGLKSKYSKIAELVAEISKTAEEVFRQSFVMVTNFESPKATYGTGTSIVQSPVHSGKNALKWKDASEGERTWWVFPTSHDWNEFEALVMWVYADNGGGFFQIRCRTKKGGWMGHVKVTWTGWKEVRLPLHGKKSIFRGGTSWERVKSIQFYKEETVRVDMVIDDIMLEKKFGAER